MCGICGFYGFEDKQLLNRMTNCLKHRGDDDKGNFVSDKISLAHQRLSIIDLDRGKQPIHNENSSIHVICNGEIYNHKELRKELEGKGHKFYTDSDTEVIVHAYEEYGVDCLSKFNGMFAFAISDGGRLFIARDRLGIKPLYYYLKDKTFLFASEIKALLEFDIKRKVNIDSLFNYLTFRYTLEDSLIKGIRKLKPGHYAVIDQDGFKEYRFWDIKFSENYYLRPEEKFFNLFKDSVEKRLMSDVSLGAFVSGGIDSAAVVSQMGENVKTFTIGFENDPTNTLKDAKAVSEHFGTNHFELVEDNNILSILPRVIYHLDEPIVEPSILPGFKLAEFAKKHVTVALAGEGADEILYGYPHYKMLDFANNINKLTLGLVRIKPLPSIAKIIPENILNKMFHYPYPIGKEGKSRLSDFVSKLGNQNESYRELISLFSAKDNIINNHQNNNLDLVLDNFKYSNIQQNISHFEIKNWLPNHVLMRLDKITMAHGLEARVPFLDHRLVEYCASLPNELKLQGSNEKFILKKAMQGKLPEKIIKKRKSPFFTPITDWFDKDIRQIASSLVEKDIMTEFFNTQKIKKIIDNHNKSKLIYSRQLWALISFYVWHRLFIDNEKVKNLDNFL